MGMFKSMFKNIKKQGEAMLNEQMGGAAPEVSKDPPTRWEKAVVALNGIVGQVSKIDPDGVDVICFPGSGGEGGTDHDIFRNVKDTKGLEAMVTAQAPGGPCHMGKAMDVVLKEAFEKGFGERPCAILVLTAGRPDDHEDLTKTLADASSKVTNGTDLTITFVQVGDDEVAEKYLKQLDEDLATLAQSESETIDIVDTIKDEDIQKAVGEVKKNKGTAGALVGAFTGAALGVGGMYLYNKMNAEKRTEGWNGKWKATYEGEELATLEVKDDMEGGLTIVGWPSEGDEPGSTTGQYAESEDGYNIQFADPDNAEEIIYGTVEDEHNITWSDGTRWEEIPPDGGHWAGYAGAAAAGAAASGAAGYLLDKKFFNKAAKKIPSDYVIVLDRSQMMTVPDTGK